MLFLMPCVKIHRTMKNHQDMKAYLSNFHWTFFTERVHSTFLKSTNHQFLTWAILLSPSSFKHFQTFNLSIRWKPLLLAPSAFLSKLPYFIWKLYLNFVRVPQPYNISNWLTISFLALELPLFNLLQVFYLIFNFFSKNICFKILTKKRIFHHQF